MTTLSPAQSAALPAVVFADDEDDACFDNECSTSGYGLTPGRRQRRSYLYTKGLEHGRQSGLADLASGAQQDFSALDAMCSDYHTGFAEGYYGVFALEALTAAPR